MIVVKGSELLLVVKQNKRCISDASLTRVLKFANDVDDAVVFASCSARIQLEVHQYVATKFS